MNDAQIKHMVDRFLMWRLPDNFKPDNGISAVRPNYAPEVTWEPSGTNLLDGGQATAMVHHMVDGLPDGGAERKAALWDEEGWQDLDAIKAQNALFRAALEQAREALEPFELVCNALESSEGADLLDDTTEWTWGDAEVPFTLGDLRRTRTALAAINSALTKA